MSKRIRVCLIAVTFFLALPTVWAVLALSGSLLAKPPEGKGKGGGKDNLIATFRDFPGDFLTPPDRIQSDGKGGYVGGVDGQTQIQKNFFLLRPDKDNGRLIFLDFTDCVEGVIHEGVEFDCTTAPFHNELPVPTAGGVVALNTTKKDDLLRLPVGSSVPVNIRITFSDVNDVDQQTWKLIFAPGDEQCGGSDFALLTRTFEDTWVFEAGPNDKACLLEPTGDSTPWIFHGLYKMPFKLKVVKK